jgi:hypothetical protein
MGEVVMAAEESSSQPTPHRHDAVVLIETLPGIAGCRPICPALVSKPLTAIIPMIVGQTLLRPIRVIATAATNQTLFK